MPAPATRHAEGQHNPKAGALARPCLLQSQQLKGKDNATLNAHDSIANNDQGMRARGRFGIKTSLKPLEISGNLCLAASQRETAYREIRGFAGHCESDHGAAAGRACERCAGVWVRLRVRPDAFGNALGSSLADSASSVGSTPTTGDFARMDGAGYRGEAYDGGAAWAADVAARRAANPMYTAPVAQGEMLGGLNDVNGMDLQSDQYAGGRRAIAIGRGQSVLGAMGAAGLSAAEQRAAYGQLVRTGQLTAADFDAKGTPVVRAGQEFYLDSNDYTAGDARMGGRLIGAESGNRAALADAQTYALRMNGGSRGGTGVAYGDVPLASGRTGPAMLSQDVYTAMGDYAGSVMVPADSSPVQDPWGAAVVRTARAAWANPGEAGIGVVKAVGNIGPGLVNLGVMAPKVAVEGNLAVGNAFGLVSDDTYRNFRDVQPMQMHTWEATNDAQRFGMYGTDAVMLAAGGVSAWSQAGKVSRSTSLTYDISRWGEYGLPSDGYFARTLTREQYLDLQAGRSFGFGGKATDGYPGGMGFISSAEEARNLTTVRSYRDGLQLSYDPKYVLEFQLRDPAGLQNVIRAPYAEFVPGGKTGAGFSEWNYPGISSNNIVNGKVRVLK